jgi:hypothetical protein
VNIDILVDSLPDLIEKFCNAFHYFLIVHNKIDYFKKKITDEIFHTSIIGPALKSALKVYYEGKHLVV